MPCNISKKRHRLPPHVLYRSSSSSLSWGSGAFLIISKLESSSFGSRLVRFGFSFIFAIRLGFRFGNAMRLFFFFSGSEASLAPISGAVMGRASRTCLTYGSSSAFGVASAVYGRTF